MKTIDLKNDLILVFVSEESNPIGNLVLTGLKPLDGNRIDGIDNNVPVLEKALGESGFDTLVSEEFGHGEEITMTVTDWNFTSCIPLAGTVDIEFIDEDDEPNFYTLTFIELETY